MSAATAELCLLLRIVIVVVLVVHYIRLDSLLGRI